MVKALYLGKMPQAEDGVRNLSVLVHRPAAEQHLVDCIVSAGFVDRPDEGSRRATMTNSTPIDATISAAIERLRTAVADRDAALASTSGEAHLSDRLSGLEREKARLEAELEQLRLKRDKDVAALDELIAQLKPLIEEV